MNGTRAGAVPSTTAIRVRGLSKIYGSGNRALEALHNIELTVGEREFLAILGPSGCGKSTLLRVIAGLEKPSAGQVRCWGEEPAELSRRHALGMAFQDPTLLPWASLRANIEFVYRVKGRRPDLARVDEVLEMVGLTRLAHLRPHEASGGMRQRTSLARALVSRPRLLLLDEPFGALDAVTRHRLNGELATVWNRTQVTTVLVTHSAEEAVRLADRILIMSVRPATVVRELTVLLEHPRPAIADKPMRELVQECMGALHA